MIVMPKIIQLNDKSGDKVYLRSMVGLSSTITAPSQTFNTTVKTKVEFDYQSNTFSQHEQLQLYNNGIRIGNGISKVRIDTQLWSQSNTNCYTSVHITKNSTEITYDIFPPTNVSGHLWRSISAYANIDVQVGDVIYIYLRHSEASANNRIDNYLNSNRLTVTVLQ